MEHVLRVVVGDSQPVLKRWQKLRETVFQALIFPMGLVSSILFFSIIFMSYILLNFGGHIIGVKYMTCVWRLSYQIPYLIWVKAFLYLHSCPQTVSPASVFVTGANSGSQPSGRRWGGAAVLQPPTSKFKNIDFVDTLVCKDSRDLPFSRKQQLKPADN
jgi:hypothetical protein